MMKAAPAFAAFAFFLSGFDMSQAIHVAEPRRDVALNIAKGFSTSNDSATMRYIV
jgi:hypothetical protein